MVQVENSAACVLSVAFCAMFVEMRVGLFVVSAFLASAGVAIAQSDWVVDPWSLSAPTHESGLATALDGSHRSLAPRPAYNHEWPDEWSAELSNPWHDDATMLPGLPSRPAHPVPGDTTLESGEWAKPVPLVIDPWAAQPARSTAPVIDLIVDPWAHD